MWEERYRSDAYVYGTEPNEFLRAHIDALPMGDVLCLAEGEGRNAVHLAATGRDVHAVDLTEAGVAKTLRLAAQRGVTVSAVVADLAVHDIGASQWDAIVSIFAHMPAHVRRDLHRRVVSALRPGGVMLLEAYAPAQLGRGTGGPATVDLMMSLDVLREELEGLDMVHALETERVVVEGVGHTGVGSVVQVIATKRSG
jgi:SAM-dependent methyltransferase